MISFVIPLRPARTCQDWQRTSSLLHRTLHSIGRQTDDDYDVIVVCEDLPDPLPRSPRVSFVSVAAEGTAHDWPTGEADKARRLRRGFSEAADRAATHVVPTDADDLVSRHLAAHASTYPQVPAWRFQRGYLWPERRRLAYLKRRAFSDVCGTSMMVRPDIAARSFRTGPLFEVEPMPDGVEWFDHRGPDIPGVTWQDFPRPAAVYSIFNGDNIRMTRATARGLGEQTGRLRLVARTVSRYRPVPAGWLQREFGELQPP